MVGHGGRGTPSSRGDPVSAPELHTNSGTCAAPATLPLTPGEFSRSVGGRSYRDRSSLRRAYSRGIEHGERAYGLLRGDRRRSSLAHGTCESLVVVVIPPLLRRYPLDAGCRPERSPELLAVMTPAFEVIDRALAGEYGLRLDVGAGCHVASAVAVRPELAHVQSVELARRDVRARAAFVTERHGEAGVRPASWQVHEVELGVDRRHGAEQPQHLIDEVAAEVAQQATGGPGLQRGRVVEIHA